MLDRELFFQRQAEECRELARNAVNEDYRAFWQQTAERWEEQLRKVKQVPKVVWQNATRLADRSPRK
jgi:predicted CoA-binding protein